MRHPLCTGQAARITKAANSADGLTVVVAQRWRTRLALHGMPSAVSCCACQTCSRLWWLLWTSTNAVASWTAVGTTGACGSPAPAAQRSCKQLVNRRRHRQKAALGTSSLDSRRGGAAIRAS